MAHITNDMIHPELRLKGILFRKLIPKYKKSIFDLENTISKFTKNKKTKGVKVSVKKIRRDDGTDLKLFIYEPENDSNLHTGLLWMHGGGYATGSPKQSKTFINDFVLKNKCTVISPDYTLSTSKPFPAALNDCYDALKWLKDNSKMLNVRPNQIFVGGNSAGGGLAAALTIYARDIGEVNIAFQMPLYPMLDDRMKTDSSKNNDAPIWNTKSNVIAWKLYLSDKYETNEVSTYAAPSRLKNFNNLPPAFTYVGSIDPFLDETVDYMEKLKAAGSEVSYIIFDGCFHSFDTLAKKTSPSKRARELLLSHLTYAQKRYYSR